MKKEIIFGLVFICLVAFAVGETLQMTVTVISNELSVVFNKPTNNTKIPGVLYLMNASTNKEALRANFSIDYLYNLSGVYSCNTTSVNFTILCLNSTPGTEFTCLGDFSQTNLVPLDDDMCLKVGAFDSEGKNGTAYALVWVDNIVPWTIDNLTTSLEDAGGGQERIILSWTAPGDNNFSQIADRYVIKISDSSIDNEEEFNNAQDVGGTCASLTPSVPGTYESCHVGSFDKYDPTWHYFRIKTFDEVNGSSEMSNQVNARTTQYVNIGIDFINYSTEGKVNHTNYWYDNVTVWGNLTNHNNSVAEIDVRFEVSGSLQETKNVQFEPYETKTVAFDWIVNDPAASHNPTIKLNADYPENKNDSHEVKSKNVNVYSIVNDANLSFHSAINWPKPKEVGNENESTFYVWVDIYNLEYTLSDQNTWFYNFSIYLDSDGATLYSTQTTCGGSPCTPDSFNNFNVTYHPLMGDAAWWWRLNSGASDSEYNVSVYIGKHPEDRITVNRTVHIQ